MLPLFQLEVPASANMLVEILFQIAAFDIIPMEDFYDDLLDLEPQEPLSEKFEAVGFESVYFLHNMGSLIIAFLVYPILVLLERTLKLLP